MFGKNISIKSFIINTKPFSFMRSAKKKRYINQKKSSVIKQLNTCEYKTPKLNNLDFLNTDEYRLLMKYKNYKQPFSIETKNSLCQQYDLMIGVPVFNGEQYIENCIDSLLSQKTEYSYEIVIVDDGSTDNTRELLKKYDNYNNIRIIRQDNGGVSSARNQTLKRITGKYVFFIDSDDELKSNAIQVLLNTAFIYNADIVEGSYVRFNDDGEFDSHIHKKDDSLNNPDIPLFGFPWGKVIRADLLETLSFPEGYIFEDSICAYCLNEIAKVKYTLPDICYKYRDNQQGICATSNSSNNAIDTYFVSFHLWSYHYKHFSNSKRFWETVVGQIILNYYRTKHLPDDILNSAFRLTQMIYVSIFEEQNDLTEKEKVFDTCMRCGSFNVFCDLVSVWDYWD